MITRIELEGLILNALVEIRRIESKLNRRFKRLRSSSEGKRQQFKFSLADLEVRTRRLEALLDALSRSSDLGRPVAA